MVISSDKIVADTSLVPAYVNTCRYRIDPLGELLPENYGDENSELTSESNESLLLVHYIQISFRRVA